MWAFHERISGAFSTFFFDFVPHKIFVSTAMLRLIHTNLNILNWFFLVFTRHVNEHWKFSFKLMLFQLNGRSFIVEFLWGSIGSQHQLHEHFDRVEKDYTRNMNSRMFLQQQTSNVTLKIFIKARWLNKAAKNTTRREVCMWVRDTVIEISRLQHFRLARVCLFSGSQEKRQRVTAA